MKRRAFVTGMAAVMAAPLIVDAQPDRKPWRIGYLAAGNGPSVGTAAFHVGMRELGHVEGKSYVMEYRWAGLDLDRLPRLAAELVAANVDLIVATATSATVAASAATKALAIVTIGVLNPVETGLVKSLARPGGNVTGVTWEIGTEPVSKKLETFKEMVPKASRMAIVWNPSLPGLEEYRAPALTAARSLGMKLEMYEYAAAAEFDATLNAALRQRTDGLFVVGDHINTARRDIICELAQKAGVPTLGNDGEWTKSGCLISYAVNVSDLFRRSAIYVDRILKGAKPADLPLEQPTVFSVVINAKTARALKLTIPPSLLLRADQIIE